MASAFEIKKEIIGIISDLLKDQQLPKSLLGQKNLPEMIYMNIYESHPMQAKTQDENEKLRSIKDQFLLIEWGVDDIGAVIKMVKNHLENHFAAVNRADSQKAANDLVARHALFATEALNRNAVINDETLSFSTISDKFHIAKPAVRKQAFINACQQIMVDNKIPNMQKEIITQLRDKILPAFDKFTNEDELAKEIKTILSGKDFQNNLQKCDKSLIEKFMDLCLKLLTFGIANVQQSVPQKFNNILRMYTPSPSVGSAAESEAKRSPTP